MKQKKPKDPNKPKRIVSAETRAKISKARRARTVQPREGKTKHINDFYRQMLKDYGNNKEAVDWIQKNKCKFEEFGLNNPEMTKEAGINCDNIEVFHAGRNFYVGVVLFDNEKDRYGEQQFNQIEQVDGEMDLEILMNLDCDQSIFSEDSEFVLNISEEEIIE